MRAVAENDSERENMLVAATQRTRATSAVISPSQGERNELVSVPHSANSCPLITASKPLEHMTTYDTSQTQLVSVTDRNVSHGVYRMMIDCFEHKRFEDSRWRR